MADAMEGKPHSRTPGLTLHSAGRYDLLVWFYTLGGERSFREKMLRLANLQPGETVLDVGCGTGTLALLAARQVEPTGKVWGIDASPEMISKAARKAERQGLRVSFEVGAAQAIPFPDASFDVVVTTLMLHHLPRPSRRQLAQEMRRVLKPGGRALVIDFAKGHSHTAKILSHFHQPHGHSKLQEMVALLSDAGFAIVDSGAVGMKNLQFVRGTVAADCPRFGEELSRSQVEPVGPSPPPTEPRNQARPGGQHASGLAILVAVLLAVALHLGAVSSLINHGGDFSATSTWGFLAILGLVALKIGLMVCWRSRWRQGAHSEVEHG